MPLSPGAVPKATAVGKPPSPCAKQSSETSLNMDITFRTGAVHGVSLREVGAIDRCRKVPRQGSHRGRGHHTNRTPPYCAAIMPIACGVRGAEPAAVAKCRRKI